MFKHKPLTAVLLAALAITPLCGAAEPDKPPAKELIEYIRDAMRRGVSDATVRQQATSVGWQTADVDAALTYLKQARTLGSSAVSATQPLDKEVPGAAASAARPSAPVQTNRGVPDGYQIDSGDTLQVSVWKEPDLTVPSVVVRPDGRISMPLVKDVDVAGLTPRQAEKVISEALSRFIADANVTVVVSAMNIKNVYVIGGVRKEGPLPYVYGMSVMQALSGAGGLTEFAKRKKIYVLRTESGREYRLNFNYDEVVKGERMEQNIVLVPADTVVVPH